MCIRPAGRFSTQAVFLVGEQQRLAGGDGEQRECQHRYQHMHLGAEIALAADGPGIGPDDTGHDQQRRQRQHQQAKIVQGASHGADDEQQCRHPGHQGCGVEQSQAQAVLRNQPAYSKTPCRATARKAIIGSRGAAPCSDPCQVDRRRPSTTVAATYRVTLASAKARVQECMWS